MRNRVNRARQSAFSLIELLLVLVILAVLAAVIVPKFTGRTQDARITAATTDISTLETVLEAYEVDNGQYPTTDEGLAALVQQPTSATNWNGPYIKRGALDDPWKNQYVYRNPGTNNPNGFDLYSLGPDGREGGDDITNWSKQ